jgi:hypothetical protein
MYTWSANWGNENRAVGKSRTRAAALVAAKAAFGRQSGVAIRVYDERNKVAEFRCELNYATSQYVWRSTRREPIG